MSDFLYAPGHTLYILFYTLLLSSLGARNAPIASHLYVLYLVSWSLLDRVSVACTETRWGRLTWQRILGWKASSRDITRRDLSMSHGWVLDWRLRRVVVRIVERIILQSNKTRQELNPCRFRTEPVSIKLAGVLFGRGYFSATHPTHPLICKNRGIPWRKSKCCNTPHQYSETVKTATIAHVDQWSGVAPLKGLTPVYIHHSAMLTSEGKCCTRTRSYVSSLPHRPPA